MTAKERVCFFTGHRFIEKSEYKEISQKLKESIVDLIENHGVDTFISGGALGFDTMAAKAVLELKKSYNIRLILFIPCLNQTAKWREEDIKIYNDIVKRCDKALVLSQEYTRDCMLLRNRKMAEAGKYCISYMRKSFGGTAYTVKYAKAIGVNIKAL